MEVEIRDEQMPQLRAFIARATGLDFPPSRWPELRRGIIAAAGAMGFGGNIPGCIHWLASGPALSKEQMDALAGQLTVGETYFFRERKHFEFLSENILPELIEARSRGDRRIRIWSAACCTGEEPYSIAMLLHRMLPDLSRWHITLLATDINPLFLKKAEAGIFGQWSFRDAPGWLKERYFLRRDDGQFEISPVIKRMVRFASLNLVEDIYPSPANETQAMDIIFCRNVLMYFTSTEAREVIRKLYRAQLDGGWLLVGSSELLHVSCSPYATIQRPGLILHRKSHQKPAPPPPPIYVAEETDVEPYSSVSSQVDPDSKPISDPLAEAAALYEQGRYVEAFIALDQFLVSDARPDILRLAAKCLANQGRLAEALGYCDKWIAIDRINPSGRYLRGLILQEQDQIDDAIHSFRAALYLDPGFVLAHVALAHIVRDRNNTNETNKHLANARHFLHRYRREEILPESEGMTAGQCLDMLESLRMVEVGR